MSPFFQTLQAETERSRYQLIQSAIIQEALRGDVTRGQYLAFLAQAYHHVKHTVPLLMACGSRLDARHEWLKKAIAEYIDEEYGHEQWILNDIKAAGGDPVAVANAQPHITTQAMVAYAYHQVDRKNPVGFFGMVHVLEGTSTALATLAVLGGVVRRTIGGSELQPAVGSCLDVHHAIELQGRLRLRRGTCPHDSKHDGKQDFRMGHGDSWCTE